MKKVSIILTMMVCLLGISSLEAQTKKERKRNKTEKVIKSKKVNTRKVKRNKVVYTNKKPKVRAVRTLPNARVVTHNNKRYHYSNGRYYRFVGGRYVVATPPRNLRVRTLPVGFVKVFVGPRSYFYQGGVYYERVGNTEEYEIVDSPQDAIVYTLPEDVEELSIDGEIYFESYGTLYKVVTTPDGKAFKVAGQLEN